MLSLFTIISCLLVAKISCDTCDTYIHPTYGKGTCIDTAYCPYSLYISGLCESKPANVKCCFSVSSSSNSVSCATPTTKLTHATAASYTSAAGMSISSSGQCTDRNKGTCTSLDQVNCATICALVNFKKASGCALTITGGTETGHASGTYSHWTGYKIDFGLSSCLDNYIRSKYPFIGYRSDGAAQYKDSIGNIYALEGNHWDVTFYGC